MPHSRTREGTRWRLVCPALLAFAFMASTARGLAAALRESGRLQVEGR
jgi:hypothetical protein